MQFGAAYEIKEQIRQAIDIVELVGNYIDLRRQGTGYVGLCPWHDDSKPSLNVSPQRQTWKCWVCDIGGDIFSFIQQREGVTFPEAMRMLAERAGIRIPEIGRSPVEPGSPEDKQTLFKAADWARGQFHQCLLHDAEAAPAREYLQKREINQESIVRYHLGFSPTGWQWLMDRARSTPYTPEVLEAVGLTVRSETSGRCYDRFRGRVIFPIRDAQRRTIAFGGRILPQAADDRSAKYINSPETKLFHKSSELYGLDVVRDAVGKSREIVVVEGYTDVVVASQFGLENFTAVLGTALGAQHIRLIRRFADSIILVLDGDEAGRRRTNEVLDLFVAEQVDLRVVTLPEGLDPCDFLHKYGADAMRRFLAGAVDALEHKIRVATEGIDLERDTHRASQALEDILQTVSRAPVGEGTQLRQQQILARLARQFRIGDRELREHLARLRQKASRTYRSAGATQGETAAAGPEPLENFERMLFEALLDHPEGAPWVVEMLGPDDIRSETGRRLLEIYCQVVEAGEAPDLGRLMLQTDDARLKSLLVSLDDQAQKKYHEAGVDSQAQIKDIAAALLRRREEKERDRLLSALPQRQLNEQEENTLLKKLIEQKRIRQGISGPTEGNRP